MTNTIKTQATAQLTLDVVTSAGTPTVPIDSFPAKWMALCIEPKLLWFGFVIVEAMQNPIQPGMTAEVRIAFLDSEGAREAFYVGASILFGDGVRSRGTLVIIEFC